MKTVNEKVIDIVENISGVTGISLDTELKKDLNLDSLDMVSVLLDVEERFGLVLDESDINPYGLKNVRDITEIAAQYSEPNDNRGDD